MWIKIPLREFVYTFKGINWNIKFSCVPFVPPPDDIAILKTAHSIYTKMERYPQALQVSLKLNDQELIQADFDNCPDL